MGDILRRVHKTLPIYMGEILRRVSKTPIYMGEILRRGTHIYRGVRLSVGVRNFSTATPIYMGEILHTPAQNLSLGVRI